MLYLCIFLALSQMFPSLDAQYRTKGWAAPSPGLPPGPWDPQGLGHSIAGSGWTLNYFHRVSEGPLLLRPPSHTQTWQPDPKAQGISRDCSGKNTPVFRDLEGLKNKAASHVSKPHKEGEAVLL